MGLRMATHARQISFKSSSKISLVKMPLYRLMVTGSRNCPLLSKHLSFISTMQFAWFLSFFLRDWLKYHMRFFRPIRKNLRNNHDLRKFSSSKFKHPSIDCDRCDGLALVIILK